MVVMPYAGFGALRECGGLRAISPRSDRVLQEPHSWGRLMALFLPAPEEVIDPDADLSEPVLDQDSTLAASDGAWAPPVSKVPYVARWTSTHAPSDAAAAKWQAFAQRRCFTEAHMPDGCFVPMEGKLSGNVRRDADYATRMKLPPPGRCQGDPRYWRVIFEKSEALWIKDTPQTVVRGPGLSVAVNTQNGWKPRLPKRTAGVAVVAEEVAFATSSTIRLGTAAIAAVILTAAAATLCSVRRWIPTAKARLQLSGFNPEGNSALLIPPPADDWRPDRKTPGFLVELGVRLSDLKREERKEGVAYLRSLLDQAEHEHRAVRAHGLNAAGRAILHQECASRKLQRQTSDDKTYMLFWRASRVDGPSSPGANASREPLETQLHSSRSAPELPVAIKRADESLSGATLANKSMRSTASGGAEFELALLRRECDSFRREVERCRCTVGDTSCVELLLTAFTYDDPELTAAATAAKQRGAKFDCLSTCKRLTHATILEGSCSSFWMRRSRAAGDRVLLFVGSHNFTKASRANREFVTELQLPAGDTRVAAYRSWYEGLWTSSKEIQAEAGPGPSRRFRGKQAPRISAPSASPTT
ncbi:unnamed protein product [Symbiodinium sp. CCMP2456]|nr:unnamed protein product [Symbiodinium sp. CCMP2456]